MKTFGFMRAMRLTSKGTRVYRIPWGKGIYVAPHHTNPKYVEDLSARLSQSTRYTPTYADINATDWTIYESTNR